MSLFKNWIALVLLCSSVLGQGALELDRSALEAYRAQDYELAAERWTAALAEDAVQNSSNERARILHNLGNVAMRNGDPLAAVAHYRASLKLRPRDAGTQANLDFARTDAQLDPAARTSLFSSMTLSESERLVLILAFALFLALLGEAFFGGGFKHVAAVAALLLLVSLIPWVGNLVASGKHEAMVVKRTGTSLHSEPRAGATALTKLDPGSEHLVHDELPDWIAVETAEGLEGWVKAKDLLSTSR